MIYPADSAIPSFEQLGPEEQSQEDEIQSGIEKCAKLQPRSQLSYPENEVSRSSSSLLNSYFTITMVKATLSRK